MNRRQFIKSSIGVAALAAMPVSVASAVPVKPVRLGMYELFQDAKGTIPVTADGQPVGLMRVIETGESYMSNLIQKELASRPVYRNGSVIVSPPEYMGVDGTVDFDNPAAVDQLSQALSLFSRSGWK
jgi:hypothetical protein